jgi:hypothetical protein
MRRPGDGGDAPLLGRPERLRGHRRLRNPDESTLFVGIQHPGEAPTGVNDPANPKRYSSWPDGDAGGRPRSSLIVITKDDGGPVGS